jgi:hypothetical protein
MRGSGRLPGNVLRVVLPGHGPRRPGTVPDPRPGLLLPGTLECEAVIDRHKTDMGEGRPVLRSRDPTGVAQEM